MILEEAHELGKETTRRHEEHEVAQEQSPLLMIFRKQKKMSVNIDFCLPTQHCDQFFALTSCV